jgi:hypothetical protein
MIVRKNNPLILGQCNMNNNQIIHIRIDNESIDAIRALAVINYRSINNQIILIIHEWLKQNKGIK